jgi:hypothetical protein
MALSEDTKNKKSNEEAWAKPVSKLSVGEAPEEAMNLNVDGREVVGPLQGFGQLWQKTYKVRMTESDVAPVNVVKVWKERLPEFMPDNSRFYPSLSGVAPGEVVLINATLPGIPGGLPISTGVMILYADDESFTVMTPEGHPESGFNTFNAYEEDGATVAQIQSLARANDPVFELGFRFMGGSSQQEQIWHHVLTQLADNFGVNGQIEMQKVCVDSRMQWSQAKNVWHNAIIRTTLNAPRRWAKRLTRR